jgi:predicted nucleic acid-binding protein
VIGFLDTSVLVRYLTGDPSDQVERAAELIDSDQKLSIPLIALVETAYVLTTLYGVDRALVVDSLIALLGRANITTHELRSERAAEALGLCRRSRRVSFADALVWATAATAEGRVFTFDQRFPSKLIDRRLLT